MKSIEKSAKTVEEAIKQGLNELGLESTDVNIDVLDLGSPGLFGMFGRLAKVRMTVKEHEPSLDDLLREASRPEKPAKPTRPEQPKPPKPAAAAPQPQRQPQPEPVMTEQPKHIKPAPSAPKTARQPAPKPERRPAPERTGELPPTDIAALSETGRAAYDFISRLVALMGVDVEVRLIESDGQITAQMNGDTLGILIGRRGETLDALQYLTSLVVNKSRSDYIRVSLDTENYRAKREEALIKLANRMAARARKTGTRVALEPMNPYERRILHSALQGNPYVTTHSEGEEPYRRVIITLK